MGKQAYRFYDGKYAVSDVNGTIIYGAPFEYDIKGDKIFLWNTADKSSERDGVQLNRKGAEIVQLQYDKEGCLRTYVSLKREEK
jgi:hypothetical protein